MVAGWLRANDALVVAYLQRANRAARGEAEDPAGGGILTADAIAGLPFGGIQVSSSEPPPFWWVLPE